LSGAGSGATGKIIGKFFGNDEDTEAEDSNTFVDQSKAVIQQIGQNANSPEEIPAALDGFSTKVEIDDKERSKTFSNGDN